VVDPNPQDLAMRRIHLQDDSGIVAQARNSLQEATRTSNTVLALCHRQVTEAAATRIN